VQLEGLGKLKNCIDLIGNRTQRPPACNIVLSIKYATVCPGFSKEVGKFIDEQNDYNFSEIDFVYNQLFGWLYGTM
jgi:hypothetical protein